jgi:hypothetical protein
VATGDPRKSIAERYGDHDGYVRAVSAAAEKLVRKRAACSAERAAAHRGLDPLAASKPAQQNGRVRRLTAALVATVALGYAAFPAVAALCCAPASSRGCCASNADDEKALRRAPCCAIGVARQPREAATPRTGGWPAVLPALSAPSVTLVVGGVREVAPACVLAPSRPPLGPPLRLRI